MTLLMDPGPSKRKLAFRAVHQLEAARPVFFDGAGLTVAVPVVFQEAH